MTDKHAAALQVGKRIAGGRGLSSVLLPRLPVEHDLARPAQEHLAEALARGDALGNRQRRFSLVVHFPIPFTRRGSA